MTAIYLCDDNKIMLDKYEEILRDLSEKHDIPIHIRTFTSGEQLLFSLEDNVQGADVIYLDVLMEELNGIETGEKLRQMGSKADIIYLTSSEEYVFDSFNVTPLGYIIKGECEGKKFEDLFLKAVGNAQIKEEECFSCERSNVIQKIPLKSISYFEVQQRIVTVHFDNETFEFYSTIDNIESQLKEKGFIRTSRAFLVNLTYISRIDKDEITLVTKDVVPLGVTYSKRVKSALSQYLTSQI